MHDDNVGSLVAGEVERHRPAELPPFETLTARWRRRRTVRRGVAAAAVVVVAAVAVPAVLSTRSAGPGPHVAAPSASVPRPAGPVPGEVTGVSACRGTDCRTVDDPGQVRLLVDDLNASTPYQNDDYRHCTPDPVGVTLTFSGPTGPYPVVTVFTSCTWWAIAGDARTYEATTRVRDDALQAQRFGLVVHDCFVTSPYLEPHEFATGYVGLTLAEARARAGRSGITVRILGQDGDCADLMTDDHRGPTRVNLYLEGGRVKSASHY